jgi:hypothetical protein
MGGRPSRVSSCGLLWSRYSQRTVLSIQAVRLLAPNSAATCITGGLLILANVQANRVGKGSAILHLITSSFISTISTPVTIVLVRPFFPESWDILRGEGVMGIVNVSGWMGMAAIALFVLFTIIVLLSRQPAAVHTDPKTP